MLPIRLPELSVNHSVPSGAVTIPSGRAPPVGRENWVITPAVVIRPIALLEELRPKISTGARGESEARYSQDELTIAQALEDLPSDMRRRLTSGERTGE